MGPGNKEEITSLDEDELTQRKVKCKRSCKSLPLFCAEVLLGKEVMWKGRGYSIMVFGRGIIETVWSTCPPCSNSIIPITDREGMVEGFRF